MSAERTNPWHAVWLVLGICVVGIVTAFILTQSRRTGGLSQDGQALQSRIDQLRKENDSLRDLLREANAQLALHQDGNASMPVYSRVGNFQLTNQHGKPVTFANYKGGVWLANIVFTRCPGPCPLMTKGMADLLQSLPKDLPVKFVTLTTDPDHDTPERLKSFSETYKPDYTRWAFLTGSKTELAKLAVEGLKLTGVEKTADTRTSAADLFIHSTIMVIVDAQGQVRGTFEFTDAELSGKVLAAIKQLIPAR
ncbi:MAG: SCO family protein [Pedosphaera sp.]|nr:SCO family protein [Pedosphaera sp.]